MRPEQRFFMQMRSKTKNIHIHIYILFHHQQACPIRVHECHMGRCATTRVCCSLKWTLTVLPSLIAIDVDMKCKRLKPQTTVIVRDRGGPNFISGFKLFSFKKKRKGEKNMMQEDANRFIHHNKGRLRRIKREGRRYPLSVSWLVISEFPSWPFKLRFSHLWGQTRRFSFAQWK